jgi:hypothetical protein
LHCMSCASAAPHASSTAKANEANRKDNLLNLAPPFSYKVDESNC